MNSRLKYTFVLSSLLIITSCGGGGGGGGSTAVAKLAAAISSFTSNIFSTEVGSSVDISWSSTNATSCSASGSWAGSKSTTGSETVEISTAGESTFTLTCNGEGGNASRTITIEGYRNIQGVAVDGYISGASIFIDTDSDYALDSNETSTTSSTDGSFTIKYENGVLASLGGQDVDTQTQLNNLLLLRDLSGYSESSFMVTPVTSVAHFMPSQDIYTVLGLDSDLDIYTTDPVANIGDGGGYDLLYEKGNQLTILAYSLQNISNSLNSSMDSTADYFKAISEEIVIAYTDNEATVNIEKDIFIEKVIDNLISAKSLTIDDANKQNAVKALSSVIPVIGIKSTNDLTASVLRFSTNKFQDDFLLIVNGTADQSLISSYSSDVLNYIATDQNVNVEDIQPTILAFSDSISLQEDSSVSFSPLLNDSLTTGSSFVITTSSPSNGSVAISGDTLTYTPSANFNGQDSFDYTVTQGSISATSSVSVTVAAVNDAPTLGIASTINYVENKTDSINPSAADVDGDDFTLTLGGTDAESFELSATNILSFVSPPDFETKDSYSITLTITDGVETVEKSITINITDVNESVGYKVPTSIDVIETKD
ncbi:Ig-like domain-containing protein [Gammaproteobacteria bacterium]|nr:Ig-like domain-containing protein [Gammaproteobacteria bacterium]